MFQGPVECVLDILGGLFGWGICCHYGQQPQRAAELSQRDPVSKWVPGRLKDERGLSFQDQSHARLSRRALWETRLKLMMVWSSTAISPTPSQRTSCRAMMLMPAPASSRIRTRAAPGPERDLTFQVPTRCALLGRFPQLCPPP